MLNVLKIQIPGDALAWIQGIHIDCKTEMLALWTNKDLLFYDLKEVVVQKKITVKDDPNEFAIKHELI